MSAESELELETLKAELMGVAHAKQNLKVRLLQIDQETVRIKNHIEVQAKREEDLKAKISQMESKG